MQFCKEHWERLREAINNKGLGHLVSNSGKELFERTTKELHGGVSIPDPLFMAHNMIISAALNDGGLEIMMPDENGNKKCPLCEVKKNPVDDTENLDEEWIEGSTQDVLDYYQKQGIISVD